MPVRPSCTLGPLDGELGDRGVVFGRTIESGGDDLTLDRSLHIGDLFRALVDEHNHQVDLRIVLRDRIGDRLQNEGFTGFRRRHDEPALTFSNRGDQIDDAGGQLAGIRFQAQALLRVEGGELAEFDPVCRLFDRQAVDRFNFDDRVVLLTAVVVVLLRLANGADDGVTLAQIGRYPLVRTKA
jgi:hypothetical protein